MLEHYIEITHLPSRNLLASLISCVKTEKTKGFLAGLVEDNKKYDNYVSKGSRILSEILEDIAAMEKETPSIPLEVLIEGLPRLKCRYYSISSSALVSFHIYNRQHRMSLV